jgi:nucleoside-diphosphate-sugar epimerase
MSTTWPPTPSEGLSHFIKRYNYTNNLLGSVNLINAAVNHAVKCFVFTSSIAVYGTAQLPMHEEILPSLKIRTASPNMQSNSTWQKARPCLACRTSSFAPTMSTANARTSAIPTAT